MSLFEAEHTPQIDPKDALVTVHQFLKNCLEWAEKKEIPKTMERLHDGPDDTAVARLHKWTTYRDFTRHTLKELEDGTLDHWFLKDSSPDGVGTDGL